MSWIRSSKGFALLAVLVVAFAAVGTVSAVSLSNVDTPAEAQVGDEITAEFTFTELYDESTDWTLEGSSQLRNVTGWTVEKAWSNGTTSSQTYQGQSNVSVEVTKSENVESMTLSITGDVPPVETFSYDPAQTFVAADFDRVEGNNVNDIDELTVHYYTEDSQAAREAIDEASDVVADSGNQDAQSTLESAIGVFDGNGENFDEAITLAEDAQSKAESAQQSAQTTQLILYGVGALVVIGVLGGGIYYWRSQQDDYDKLR